MLVPQERVWLFADYNQAESRVVAWKGPVPKLKQWYVEGVDVHSYVCRLIARVIQENKITTPLNTDTGKLLFKWKEWESYGKGDEERELAKRGVHAYNYGMGAAKYALILGISEEFAATILRIIATLFPEIKGNYHAWVEKCVRSTRTIWMPEPVRFRKIFYDTIDDELMRSAYSCYPQCTVASMLNRTIAYVTTIFREDRDERLKEQWCSWYGTANWNDWRILRSTGSRSPQAILWSGMDVRLNVHDAGGISIPNDPDLLLWAATTWKAKAEEEIVIASDNKLSIPVDFKVGPTWGAADLADYKLTA